MFLYLQAVTSSVWGSISNSSSQWNSDTNSIWGDNQNSNLGFWDDAVKEPVQPPSSRQSNKQKNKSNMNLR